MPSAPNTVKHTDNTFIHFEYCGITVDCETDVFTRFVTDFLTMPPDQKKMVLTNLNKSMANFAERDDELTPQEMEKCWLDIIVFFANEAAEGRLENYENAVQ